MLQLDKIRRNINIVFVLASLWATLALIMGVASVIIYYKFPKTSMPCWPAWETGRLVFYYSVVFYGMIAALYYYNKKLLKQLNRKKELAPLNSKTAETSDS